MACKDCLQNCPEIISDQCVQYTGPALGSPFNVCTGDQLPVLEAALVANINSAISGTGIMPTVTVTGCTWLSQMFGILPLNLSNILQILINGECSLYSMIQVINAQISSSQGGQVIDTGCLTGLTATPTTPEIIQAIITLLCGINTTIASFPSTYVRLTDLTSLVTPIVNNIVGSTNYSSRMVPFAAQPYFGPLSNFDSSGIGISTLGFNKIYLCNGANGTPDLRGRVPVGAIRNVPGGSLDPAVDPIVDPNNPNWGLSDKAGETFHTLSTPEIPAHNHPYTDPGHTHPFIASGMAKSGSTTSPLWIVDLGADQPPRGTNTFTNKVQSATIGITIGQTGGGQAHNNIQPSIACYYIIYIP